MRRIITYWRDRWLLARVGRAAARGDIGQALRMRARLGEARYRTRALWLTTLQAAQTDRGALEQVLERAAGALDSPGAG